MELNNKPTNLVGINCSKQKQNDVLWIIYSSSSGSMGAASIKNGFVPFKPGILAISAGFRIVPFSVSDGRWLKLMKLVSLCVILTIVPVNGNVLKISEAFWMLPKLIGAMPVRTWPVTFVCTGNGIWPKSKWLPFDFASKNVRSTRSWLFKWVR